MTAQRNPVRCSDCGTQHDACPRCEGRNLTLLEPPTELPLATSASDFIQRAEDGDSATFTNVCWNCGWKEDRTITVGVTDQNDA